MESAKPTPVEVTLTDDELRSVFDLVERRWAVPVDRVELTEAWTTHDGYRIEHYLHVRDYPPELILGGHGFRIMPGQRTEMRGWPCPRCGSVKPSSWGFTTVVEAWFQCQDCQAEGEWSPYCTRSPAPIHLDDRCDCEPEWAADI